MNLKSLKNRKNAGFTLIELLVVVLIMGVLMAVALPLYLSSVRNAGDGTVKGNIRSIVNAEQALVTKTTGGAFTDDWTLLSPDLGGAGAVCPFNNNPGTVTYDIAVGGSDLTGIDPGTGAAKTLTVGANDLVITAAEGASDSFGAAGTGDTMAYVLPKGASIGEYVMIPA